MLGFWCKGKDLPHSTLWVCIPKRDGRQINWETTKFYGAENLCLWLYPSVHTRRVESPLVFRDDHILWKGQHPPACKEEWSEGRGPFFLNCFDDFRKLVHTTTSFFFDFVIKKEKLADPPKYTKLGR